MGSQCCSGQGLPISPAPVAAVAHLHGITWLESSASSTCSSRSTSCPILSPTLPSWEVALGFVEEIMPLSTWLGPRFLKEDKSPKISGLFI